MNIERCKTCKRYDKFYNACDIFVRYVNLGNGELPKAQPVSIYEVPKEECNYEHICDTWNFSMDDYNYYGDIK